MTLRSDVLDRGPDRRPLPTRLASIEYEPLDLGRQQIGPFRLAGVWRVTAEDPRFGGLSALAITRLGLLAVTDSGAVAELPKPGVSRRVARFRDLPSGPGWPTFKRNRDSEALVYDARRRGWWIAFEYRHGLWSYDREFRSGRLVRSLDKRGWPRNKGVEAMVLSGPDGLLLLPERSQRALLLGGRGIGERRLAGANGQIADAVRLPDGRMLVTQRDVGLGGITNRLAWLEREGARFRLQQIGALALGPFDNVEGLAAERLPDGSTRVWAVTDNDGWRRTLLLALDLPPTAERRPRSSEAAR